MGRISKYTEEDKARTYVVLMACDGNITRASRETGIPAQTIRDWRDVWESEGPPDPDIVDGAVAVFVEEVERVRNKALTLLDNRMDQIKNPKDLATVFGILDDKVRLARGLATSRSESIASLPSPDEMRALFQGMIAGAVMARESRDQDIIDVKLENNPKELSA